MLTKIISTIAAERETVIDIQRLLVSIPAVAPEGQGQGEQEKAEALQKHLAKLGFPEPFEMRAPDPRVPCGYRPSLSYIIPGEDTSRTFWILSHIDVVPPGERSLWNTDPFELKVEGDLLFGRGVEDNHQGLVSSFLLGKALVQQKVKPPMNLGLLFIADEENGNKFGIEYILREHQNIFGKNDLFIVPDFGNPTGSEIEISEKSILWTKVTVTGKQCHASTPNEGKNTLRAASDFIVRLKRLEETFNRKDALFNPPQSTFEPTKKDANVESINIIPGHDIFYIDSRVLPIYDLDEVLRAIEDLGAEIAKEYEVSVACEPIQKLQAAPPTSPDAEIVKKLIPAICETYKVEPKTIGVGGGTFAAALRRNGFEVAVWSTLLENAHQPNEHAKISSIIGDAKVMAKALWG